MKGTRKQLYDAVVKQFSSNYGGKNSEKEAYITKVCSEYFNTQKITEKGLLELKDQIIRALQDGSYKQMIQEPKKITTVSIPQAINPPQKQEKTQPSQTTPKESVQATRSLKPQSHQGAVQTGNTPSTARLVSEKQKLEILKQRYKEAYNRLHPEKSLYDIEGNDAWALLNQLDASKKAEAQKQLEAVQKDKLVQQREALKKAIEAKKHESEGKRAEEQKFADQVMAYCHEYDAKELQKAHIEERKRQEIKLIREQQAIQKEADFYQNALDKREMSCIRLQLLLAEEQKKYQKEMEKKMNLMKEREADQQQNIKQMDEQKQREIEENKRDKILMKEWELKLKEREDWEKNQRIKRLQSQEQFVARFQDNIVVNEKLKRLKEEKLLLADQQRKDKQDIEREMNYMNEIRRAKTALKQDYDAQLQLKRDNENAQKEADKQYYLKLQQEEALAKQYDEELRQMKALEKQNYNDILLKQQNAEQMRRIKKKGKTPAEL